MLIIEMLESQHNKLMNLTKGGAAFFDDYVKLLRATGSMSAEDLAREHLQVDLRRPEFWQASVDIARSQVDAFEQLMGEVDGAGQIPASRANGNQRR